MTVLSDKWIKNSAIKKGMIKPFVNKQVRKGKISFGLSSFGYDARVSNEFKIFTNVNSGIVDPKVFKKESFVTKIGSECIIPPNSFALARTVGWVAHWNEMLEDKNFRIGRPRQLYTGKNKTSYVDINER